jgi:RecA/RadA recombinase
MPRTKGSKNKDKLERPVLEDSKKKSRGRPKKTREQKEGKSIIEEALQKSKEIAKNIVSETLKEETIKPEKNEKLERAKKVLGECNRKLGTSAIVMANTIEEVQRLSFRTKSLNDLTGGGVPYGRTTCIWGSKGCAKTTVALELIAMAQKENKVCLYADIERSYSPDWAEKQGVDTSKLLHGKFYNAEQPLDAIIKMAKEKVVDVIVVDSVQGLCPKGEMYDNNEIKSTDKETMALLPRKLSQFFRMAIPFIADGKVALILIGQSRMDLSAFIKIEKLSGGHALAHNSRLIIRFRRGAGDEAPTTEVETEELNKKGNYKTKEVKIGFDMVARIDKSQVKDCVEGTEAHMPFIFKQGIIE